MPRKLPADFPKTAADWDKLAAAAPGEESTPASTDAVQPERAVVVCDGGPLAVREACEREVATGGWGSLSDYLLSVVAPAVGMPEQAPEPKFAPVEDQENLPLTG